MAAELAERIAVVTYHSYCSIVSNIIIHKATFCTFSRESISLILDVFQTWLAYSRCGRTSVKNICKRLSGH